MNGPIDNSAAKDVLNRLGGLLTDAYGMADACRGLDEGAFLARLATRIAHDIDAVRERLELCCVEPHPEWHEAYGVEARDAVRAREVEAARKLRLRLESTPVAANTDAPQCHAPRRRP